MRIHLQAGLSRAAAATLLGGALLMPGAHAAAPGHPASPTAGSTAPADLGTLLRRIQDAGLQQSYVGTYVTSSGGQIR